MPASPPQEYRRVLSRVDGNTLQREINVPMTLHTFETSLSRIFPKNFFM